MLMGVSVLICVVVVVIMMPVVMVMSRPAAGWPGGGELGTDAVVVVVHVPLMAIVVMDDQGAGFLLTMSLVMRVPRVFVGVFMMMVVPMVMGVVMMMDVGVSMMMLVTLFMLVMMTVWLLAGNARLAASAYAAHINLPRCR